MLVEPDYSEVAEVIQPGDYKVRVVGATAGEWSTGTKYINWRLETFDEVDAKNNGRSIFHKTPTHGKGAFRLRDLAAAVQVSIDGAFDTDDLMGKELHVVVVEGTDKEGNPSGYPEVKSVRRLV